MIRRDRTFAPPRYQGTGRTEKTSSAGQTQAAARTAGLTVSETLQEMAGKVSQMENGIRESRRTLQTGQGVLAEVREGLERLAELAQRAAESDDPAAFQAELEQLRGELERMIRTASVDDTPLFLGGNSEIRGAAQLLVQLLEQAQAGVSPDQAIRELTDGAIESLAQLQELLDGGGLQGALIDLLMTNSGAALLQLLMGMKGENLDLMLGLLTALQTTQAETGAGSGPEAAVAREAGGAVPGDAPLPVKEFGAVQVTGKDLSGVTFDRETGELVLAGTEELTVRGTEEALRAIRLTGSGAVTLRDVKGALLTVDSSQARLFTRGSNVLDSLELGKGTSLTLGGEGRLELGGVRGDLSNTLRLTGGGVIVRGEKGEPFGRLDLPVVVDGPASLAAHVLRVTDPEGKPMKPFDLLWSTLLPGWGGLSGLKAGERQGRLALLSGDPARLWLAQGDPSQGFPAHSLTFQSQEKSGQIRTRYAYLQWNRRSESFEEAAMYPNPFAVTGGEAERDWVYEEETQTLRILSSRVTAVSGGVGVDANRLPFSGRIVLADGIGAVELTLDSVTCQVIFGRAFDLGEENTVTLVLPGGASNLFASGAGCAGITLGEGTCLCVDCVQPGEEDEDGTLTAAGGVGCAGIGRDGVAGWDPADPVLIRGAAGEEEHSFLGPVTIASGTVLPDWEEEQDGAVVLQRGEEAVTLPQFRLSVRALGLSGMSLMTREYARDAGAVLEAGLRRVDQIQKVYSVLYDWLDQGARNLPGTYLTPSQGLVRDAGQAGTLLEDMRKSILSQPSQAMYTHGRRGAEHVCELLK